MASSDAPLSVGAVTLLTRNRAKVALFYENVVGLNVISSSGDTLTLGQGDFPLLHLREDPAAKRRPTEAGLFHTAFVLPEREDLGAWVSHANEQNVKLDGAADHLVSEALYLEDPEGNGVEVYVDRDRTHWQMEGSNPKLATLPLDLKELVNSSKKHWQSAPPGTVIGHVHLQVGDVATTDSFYCDEIGFERMTESPTVNFYGSGGYHHHIAGNTWRSLRAGKRSEDSTGLLQIDFLAEPGGSGDKDTVDPWGVVVTVR